MHVLPMHMREAVIGVTNLFGTDEGPLSAEDVAAGQALAAVAAAVATIAILHQRVASEWGILVDQLDTAFTSRVVIEEAKGVLAERAGLSVEWAFEAMRHYARDRNLPLADVARSVNTTLVPADLSARRPRRPS